MFYISSIRFDITVTAGTIYGLTIYKIPDIPQEILDKAFLTPMWLEYYFSFIQYIHKFENLDKNYLYDFNGKKKIEEHVMGNKQINKDEISINYERILKDYGIEI